MPGKMARSRDQTLFGTARTPEALRSPPMASREPREIAPESTGHGLPLNKCEAYDRVYDQSFGSH